MEIISPFASGLHTLSAIVWVGGMFFTYFILRPAASSLGESERIKLWAKVLKVFFNWVWASAILLLITGYWQIFWIFGGVIGLQFYIKLMMGIGILMIFIFFYLYFGPYELFIKSVKKEEWVQAKKNLDLIRKIVFINLLLGLLTSAIGASGRIWL